MINLRQNRYLPLINYHSEIRFSDCRSPNPCSAYYHRWPNHKLNLQRDLAGNKWLLCNSEQQLFAKLFMQAAHYAAIMSREQLASLWKLNVHYGFFFFKSLNDGKFLICKDSANDARSSPAFNLYLVA